MQEIGAAVDHRDRGVARQLDRLGVRVGADHQQVEVAGEHSRRAAEQLARLELDVVRREEHRVGAELMGAHLEGDPGAGRAGREEEPDALPLERAAAHLQALELPRGREQRGELLPGEIGEGEEVAFRGHEPGAC